MHLARLRLQGFRNLADVRLELPPEGIALVGPNAQGKTNLLEAIHYLELFRSFRGVRDAELVRFGEAFFRVEGVVRGATGGGEERTLAAAWQREGARKRVTLDGVEPERLADAVGHLGAVLFTPADLALVNDGPHERRRFLDIVLSLNEPGYLGALQRYRRVLGQRNAALREGGAAAIAAWDEPLVREGARVFASRRAWIAGVGEAFASLHAEISGGEPAELVYLPALPTDARPDDAETFDESLRSALRSSVDQERRMQTTVVGPHRDEFRMRVPNGGRLRDVRSYGSGGQRRSVALALRLLEARTLEEQRGRAPILLMDDVFAELDEARSERVLELLERTAVGQVILTAPRASDIRLRGDRLPRWSIRDGVIQMGEWGP